MSETAGASSSEIASTFQAKPFNILDPRDYQNVMQEFSQNTKLLNFMQTTFKLTYDLTRGLRSDELNELIGSNRGTDTQLAIEEVKKLTNGQSTCVAMGPTDPKRPETTLVFGQMVDNKYDVLDIRVSQTTQIDQSKLAAITLGATCAGVFTSFVGTPMVGLLTTGAILTGAGLKALHDRQTSRPDLLYGYIFKELNDRNVLRLKDGHPFF